MYQKLQTEMRDSQRKVSLKSLRSQGIIPGVIYGKGMESLTIQVPMNKLNKFLHTAGRVFEVEVVGNKTYLVNLDDIQYDHLGNHPLHVALHKLEAGQKTRVTIPIHYLGDAKGHRLSGGVVHQAYHEIEVEGLPKDIPQYIEVDISELDLNSSIHLSDINCPAGIKFMEEGEIVLVSCHPARVEKVEEPVSPADTPTLEGVAEAADSIEEESKSEAS